MSLDLLVWPGRVCERQVNLMHRAKRRTRAREREKDGRGWGGQAKVDTKRKFNQIKGNIKLKRSSYRRNANFNTHSNLVIVFFSSSFVRFRNFFRFVLFHSFLPIARVYSIDRCLVGFHFKSKRTGWIGWMTCQYISMHGQTLGSFFWITTHRLRDGARIHFSHSCLHLRLCLCVCLRLNIGKTMKRLKSVSLLPHLYSIAFKCVQRKNKGIYLENFGGNRLAKRKQPAKINWTESKPNQTKAKWNRVKPNRSELSRIERKFIQKRVNINGVSNLVSTVQSIEIHLAECFSNEKKKETKFNKSKSIIVCVRACFFPLFSGGSVNGVQCA